MLNTELPVLFPKWYKEVGALQGAEVVRAELLSRDKMEAYERLPRDLTHYSWGSVVRKIVRETQRGPFLDTGICHNFGLLSPQDCGE